MITLMNCDAFAADIPPVDMIFTDPPFEMPGNELAALFERIDHKHLVLICTQRQALEYYKAASGIDFSFDLVVSHVSPRKSMSYQQPQMLHSNILYFRKHGCKSVFDRRRVERSDQFGAPGYYPSIFHAPKTDRVYKYQKNQLMINDVLGAFAVESVCDPFAGSGTTAVAAVENSISTALMIEKDAEAYSIMRDQLYFLTKFTEV